MFNYIHGPNDAEEKAMADYVAVTMTRYEYDALIRYMEHQPVITDEVEPLCTLTHRLAAASTVTVKKSMLYVNVYEIHRIYVGDEEGSRYAKQQNCMSSYGMSLFASNLFDDPSIIKCTELAEIFCREANYYCSDTCHYETAEVVDALMDNILICCIQTNDYGDGYIVALEHEPGEIDTAGHSVTFQ